MHLFEREGVDDVFFLDPSFFCDGDAPLEIVELVFGMGIGIDCTKEPSVDGGVPKSPIHVEALGLRVELHNRLVRNAGIDDL